MSWQPTASLETLATRARMLSCARAFFDERNVQEVDTPALSSHAVSDPHIESLTAQTASGETWFLHSSPEYRMKRLLAAGSPDIYQIGHVFRGSERGRHHQPEFCMIEWYRRGMTLADMATETCELLNALGAVAGCTPDAVSFHRYDRVFYEATGLDPLNADLDALHLYASRHVETRDPVLHAGLGDDRAAWLDLLMSHQVIPALPRNELVVVSHYPAELAALARLDPDNTAVAERFEVFRNGLELANGYRELRDPIEQRQRFDQDNRQRQTKGLPLIDRDPLLIDALEHGLPDCCGVAVGFDRAVMAYLQLDRIDQAISFTA